MVFGKFDLILEKLASPVMGYDYEIIDVAFSAVMWNHILFYFICSHSMFDYSRN